MSDYFRHINTEDIFHYIKLWEKFRPCFPKSQVDSVELISLQLEWMRRHVPRYACRSYFLG